MHCIQLNRIQVRTRRLLPEACKGAYEFIRTAAHFIAIPQS